MARIELTIYSEDAKQLFEWSLSDKSIAEDLINFVHFNLGLYDINVDRYDRSLDDVVRFLSQTQEPEDSIYQLKALISLRPVRLIDRCVKGLQGKVF